MDGPPENDFCSICHCSFHFPFQANCSHWYCGMLQNPQYRQELQTMLQNPQNVLNRMDSMKSFDLNSPEIKQQFDEIGLTPDKVFSKIMGNPEIAMSFQNPRIQQAIMDRSQKPMSITKYQNDKEVMDVFTKISELFPGVSRG